MRYVKFLCILAFLACNTSMAQSKNHALPSDINERELLKQERKNIETSFASKEANCYKKFSVNPCLDQARADRNTALAENRRRELLLNDLKREEKKQNSLKIPKAISKNPNPSDDANRKPPDRAIADQNKRINAAKARAEMVDQKKREAHSKAIERTSKNLRSADAAAKFQEKLETAESHKTAVEQKNASNSKPKASSLPIPKDVTN